MGIAGSSFKLYSQGLSRIKEVCPVNSVHFSWLVSSLESLLFYAVENETIYSDRKTFHYYFSGDQNKMSYITKASISKEKEEPVIHTINRVGSAIILSESSLYLSGQNYLNPSPDKDIAASVTIFSDVKDHKLIYEVGNKSIVSLKGRVPETVILKVTYRHDLEETFFFRIQSRFDNKKNLTYNAKFPEI